MLEPQSYHTRRSCRPGADRRCWPPEVVHAIDRAVVELVDNPWIARGELHGIIVVSPTSGNLYAANGTCQCESYRFNRPCWHRAAARWCACTMRSKSG